MLKKRVSSLPKKIKKLSFCFYAQSATRTHALAERDLNPPE